MKEKKKSRFQKEPLLEKHERLEIGTTYCNFPIKGYAPRGEYITECPGCGADWIKSKLELEKATCCIKCFRKKKYRAVCIAPKPEGFK